MTTDQMITLTSFFLVAIFCSTLTLVISPVGLAVWFVVLVVGSITASAYPAQQASRLTVRETLAYV